MVEAMSSRTHCTSTRPEGPPSSSLVLSVRPSGPMRRVVARTWTCPFRPSLLPGLWMLAWAANP